MTTHTVRQLAAVDARQVAHRTKGHQRGPITRLMNPSDLGDTLKPFVFLDYFEFGPQQGFGSNAHPHSGIATHTTFLQRAFEYGDSTGKIGSMGPGSVEWMQAGSGAWHWGRPLAGTTARGYQLWVALPPELELSPARSTYVDADHLGNDGRVAALLGDYATPVAPSRPSCRSLPARPLDRRRGVDLRTAPRPRARLVGDQLRPAAHGPRRRPRQELAVFSAGSAPIALHSEGSSEFVISSARAHRHDLVLGPSSVDTSEDTLLRGHATDFQTGRFGHLDGGPLRTPSHRGTHDRERSACYIV